VYLAPWLHGFGALTGLFVAALFAYLASVFFFGEVSDPGERDIIWRRTIAFFGAAFVLGGAVLGMGAITGRVPLATAAHPSQIGCGDAGN